MSRSRVPVYIVALSKSAEIRRGHPRSSTSASRRRLTLTRSARMVLFGNRYQKQMRSSSLLLIGQTETGQVDRLRCLSAVMVYGTYPYDWPTRPRRSASAGVPAAEPINAAAGADSSGYQISQVSSPVSESRDSCWTTVLVQCVITSRR